MLVERIVFRNGRTPSSNPLEIEPGRVTIFIGPNNGGKTSALRDIANEFIFDHQHVRVATSSVKLKNIPDHIAEEKLSKYRTHEQYDSPERRIFARKNIGKQEVNEIYLADLLARFNSNKDYDSHSKQYISQHLLSLFALNLSGENRLALVNQAKGQKLSEPPQSTIAALFCDDSLRRALSDIIYESFHMYLAIDATDMGTFKYALSQVQPPPHIDRSFAEEAVQFFENTQPLSSASDGTKAFIGILSEVMAGEADVIIIDEPEAFLHPGLAHTLGKQIGLQVAGSKQLFAATHSPHFLIGCLSAGVPIDVVRLTHRAGSGTAQLLSDERLSQMMAAPLLRSIGVVSALFYESAVVVEADADRAFYEEINQRLNSSNSQGVRHTTFLNAHNKQTAAEIAVELRRVGVPAALILDIDWVKEDGQVCAKYFDAAGLPEGLRPGHRQTRQTVRGYLHTADPDYKRRGGVTLLTGEELATACSFFDEMERYGLFTVRTGELESWLPHLNCNRNKSVWLGEMFSALGSDPSNAEYVTPEKDDVWKLMRDVAAWVAKPDRLGMGIKDSW